ncbi:DnaD domain-containing protein [Halalkalibacillus halophilus]|uniref:DnaD domain-containing protein n=1 Tax=Halalkalibacillus halophilus TaxID=392827 RepID=UPI00041F86F7|nr:DnaD domain protein [Halalkalibacillus halophilus]
MELPFSYQKFLNEQVSVPQRLINEYTKLDLGEVDVLVILRILSIQSKGDLLPSFEVIAESMSINANEVANVLKQLKNKKYLEIKQFEDSNHHQQEWYAFDLLFHALYENEVMDEKKEEGKLFQLFEQEFARALSPIEIEMISYWLDEDQFKPALVKAALREAVLLGKLNFKYIDRILNEWKKKGIRSINQVKEAKDQRTNEQTKQAEESKKRDKSVYYNWLEE